MADSIVRLKVDSKEYDNKIRRASEGLQHFEHECRRVGGTLEYVEKEELDFVRALGSMQTVATNSRQKMMEFTNAINDMAIQYRGLTEAEKQSPYGQALSASIEQLKARAGELKDRIADTNAELNNLASDTAFTDGIGLMTRTVGACASAMAAWGGESQTMEQMIKSLAKIQTTVGAVEALTKAFQKQNLVLLKNPYVAAAAGVAALAVAMVKLIQKSQELDHVTKTINEVQEKGRENAAKEITRIEQLNSILHDNTRSLDERKEALTAIQNLVPDYHGALTKEGTLIDDNTDSISAYVAELQRAATAQAAFDKMVELQKKRLNKQTELKTKEKNLDAAKARNATAQGQVVYAGTEMTQVYTEQDISRREKAVQDVKTEIISIDQEIKALQDLTDAATIAGKAVDNVNKGGKGGSSKEKSDAVTASAGSIEYQRQLIADLTKLYEGTSNDWLRDLIKGNLDVANEELDRMLGKTKEVKAELEVAFTPGSLNALNQELSDAKEELANIAVGAEGWEKALKRVQTAQEAVNAAQSLIVPKSKETEENAKSTTDAWQNASIALTNAGSAMNSIENPAAKVAGTLAQAIASIMLGFAQASIQGAALGPWGWIATTTAALATAVATVSTIKSVTAGSYAEGGIVPGSSYSGDRLTANVNSGELILNRAQQASIASQLQEKGIDSMNIRFEIDGTKLIGVQNNTIKAKGGKRSNLIYQH